MYYNFGLIFIIDTMIPITGNYIVLKKLIAETRKHGEITKKGSDGSRNTSSPEFDKIILIQCPSFSRAFNLNSEKSLLSSSALKKKIV